MILKVSINYNIKVESGLFDCNCIIFFEWSYGNLWFIELLKYIKCVIWFYFCVFNSNNVIFVVEGEFGAEFR